MSVMPADDLERRLAEWLRQAGAAHHQAFSHVGGDDPEWPLWYARHLHADVRAALGKALTVSEIVYLLIAAERERSKETPAADWPTYYARFFVGKGV
jgi:hypothetical protein